MFNKSNNTGLLSLFVGEGGRGEEEGKVQLVVLNNRQTN